MALLLTVYSSGAAGRSSHRRRRIHSTDLHRRHCCCCCCWYRPQISLIFTDTHRRRHLQRASVCHVCFRPLCRRFVFSSRFSCFDEMHVVLLANFRKLEFHDADTDTDILARMSARMSVPVSVSWNAGLMKRSSSVMNAHRYSVDQGEILRGQRGLIDRRVSRAKVHHLYLQKVSPLLGRKTKLNHDAACILLKIRILNNNDNRSKLIILAEALLQDCGQSARDTWSSAGHLSFQWFNWIDASVIGFLECCYCSPASNGQLLCPRPAVGGINQCCDLFVCLSVCLSRFLILSRSLDGGIRPSPLQMHSIGLGYKR